MLYPPTARRATAVLALGLTAGLAGCGPAPIPSGIDDRFEAENRQRHEFNRNVDRYIYRPVSQAYGRVPEPVRTGVDNFTDNTELPGQVINGLLQGRPANAIQNTLRFLVNSTSGILGIFDPATALDLPEVDTDFGETMYVWGVGEGNYIELPFLGPSTDRDATGLVVDILLNPLGIVNLEYDYNQEIRVVTKAAELTNQRYIYSDLVDGVLYQSADSYAQTRNLYLQTRRNELSGGETSEENAYDPYDDVYGE